MAGIFPGLFALLLSILLRRLGTYAIFSAPFIWIATEFLRFWITGNNWNALAYSQAFGGGALKYSSMAEYNCRFIIRYSDVHGPDVFHTETV